MKVVAVMVQDCALITIAMTLGPISEFPGSAPANVVLFVFYFYVR